MSKTKNRVDWRQKSAAAAGDSAPFARGLGWPSFVADFVSFAG